MSTPLPYDEQVEAAVVAAMFLRPHSIPDIAGVVGPRDFYQPKMGQVFGLLVEAWRTGEPFDGLSFGAAHPTLLTPQEALVLQHDGPGGHRRIVEQLVGLRIRRDLLIAGAEVAAAARDLSLDPIESKDAAAAAIAAVETPLADITDLWGLDAFLDQPDENTPWVIPGLFKQGWRVVIVAVEGRGKSWISRQIATAAASGVHPFFTTDPIDPITTLIVDLENPADSITEAGRAMRKAAGAAWAPERMFLWHRPGGINIRRRQDRAELESVIVKARPKFVSIGPLYKLYTTTARETDEQAAGEAQAILDDLRTRYGFAVLVEHHAPKAVGKERDILPYGSSLWLRWPEMGIKLLQHVDSRGNASETKLDVEKWRLDRVPNRWPKRLERGQNWPWIGEWDSPFAASLLPTGTDEALGLDF